METLIQQVKTELANLVLPHYKEDAFRTAFAGTALLNRWTVAEPRTYSGKKVPPKHAAVYFLTLNPSRAAPAFVHNNSGSKPDLRLIAPGSNKLYTVELKCGFTGSASHSNSNASRVAEDIDLVAAGSRDLFAGLFDAGMLGRIQGALSSSGRVKAMAQLLGGTNMSTLHSGPPNGNPQINVTHAWAYMTGKAPCSAMLQTTLYPVTCRAGVQLAMVVVRRDGAGF